ncbi:ribose transport system substrate-binding protein [Azotobacter beijerinckii]|uniref:Ribose transport system substrate-binding protein n=1 Tax=Azotobacter beijerinckii TaxID=170623 RepID=A0A1H6ZNE0_9GAMM|nr:substrate-binding domain-containing protein [Azotobacter beijerinckii]SEJ54939.1 ribose transport system substrate-binding protein [Azotobacter beijerinckii]
MKKSFISRVLVATGLFCGLLLAPSNNANALQFALVAKRVDQAFFIRAGEGCAEAARAQGDTCLLLGASGTPHFRQQDEVLAQALDRDLDGIALSATHSKWLADHALKRLDKMPLITFESDLGPDERHLRRAYVGPDNLAFGQRLGKLVQHFRPQGGDLCILIGNRQDTGYQERLHGIRQQLRSRSAESGEDARLKGENGWSEPERCPLFNADNSRNTLAQLVTLLRTRDVDTIISTASWPVFQTDSYRQQVGPLFADFKQEGRRPTIVIATQEPSSAQRALLDDGLVQAYLSVDGYEVGRQCYWVLKRLSQGETVPEGILTDSHVLLPGGASLPQPETSPSDRDLL